MLMILIFIFAYDNKGPILITLSLPPPDQGLPSSGTPGHLLNLEYFLVVPTVALIRPFQFAL
jgi:hypothetical protein